MGSTSLLIEAVLHETGAPAAARRGVVNHSSPLSPLLKAVCSMRGPGLRPVDAECSHNFLKAFASTALVRKKANPVHISDPL